MGNNSDENKEPNNESFRLDSDDFSKGTKITDTDITEGSEQLKGLEFIELDDSQLNQSLEDEQLKELKSDLDDLINESDTLSLVTKLVTSIEHLSPDELKKGIIDINKQQAKKPKEHIGKLLLNTRNTLVDKLKRKSLEKLSKDSPKNKELGKMTEISNADKKERLDKAKTRFKQGHGLPPLAPRKDNNKTPISKRNRNTGRKVK